MTHRTRISIAGVVGALAFFAGARRAEANYPAPALSWSHGQMNAGARYGSDNLNLGLTVIADSVNPLDITREAWSEVAREANVRLINVEIICSDEAEHRRRVETRSSDIPDLVLPTWDKVKSREYHPWTQPRIVIDTAARGVDECVADLQYKLQA